MIEKNMLITGAAGFIGTNFVKYIVNTYPETKPIVLDKLTYAGNIHNLEEELEKDKIAFIPGDINNIESVRNIFKRYSPEIVINFAAESHVDRSIAGPRVFMKTNILGTQNLLTIAKDNWEIREREYMADVKFIQISTDEVYGALGEKGYFTEQTPLDPHSPYSASKASADLIVKAYYDTYYFPAIITRCSNNYGPYHFPEKLIPLMITNIIEGKKLPVYGEGKNIRDWIHVKDHCTAIDRVRKNGKIGEIYNIGGNCEKRNIEIVKLLIDKTLNLIRETAKYKKVLKTEIKNINYDLIHFVKDRLGHDYRYAMDSTKIMRELCWKPQIMFDDGIEQTIKWYLDNGIWIEKIKSGEYIKYNEKYRKIIRQEVF
jgi:dTDP-glucose 4,6-dehydratase